MAVVKPTEAEKEAILEAARGMGENSVAVAEVKVSLLSQQFPERLHTYVRRAVLREAGAEIIRAIVVEMARASGQDVTNPRTRPGLRNAFASACQSMALDAARVFPDLDT